jgi:threonine dehydrogenase-like Zn-dependent dehydrogenase
MYALELLGPKELRYEEIDDPVIEEPDDVIVRVRLSGICGSDLHFYRDGWSRPRSNNGIGHEAVGEIVEAGPAVVGLKPGDDVMIAAFVGCGNCSACHVGETKRCRRARPYPRAYGIGRELGGCQAEYVRVPAGSFNALPIPPGVTDEQAVLLTDNLPTGFAALRTAEVGPGRSVAVIGLGPIGLMAVEMSFAMGAAMVVAIDVLESRRERAEALGATAVHPDDAKAVVREATNGHMIDSVIEAVGTKEAVSTAMSIVGMGRNLSILGVGSDMDITIGEGASMRGINVNVNMVTEVARYWGDLVPMLQGKRIQPEQFITHSMSLSEGPSAYERSLAREPGLMKVVLAPA